MAVGFVLITTEPGEEVNVRNSLDSVEGVVAVSYTHLTLPTR